MDHEPLVNCIEALVNKPGKTWQEKRDEFWSSLSSDQKTAIIEFAGWFAEME